MTNNRKIKECGFYVARGRGYCGEDLIPCKQKISDFRSMKQTCWKSVGQLAEREKRKLEKLRKMDWETFLILVHIANSKIKRTVDGLLREP